MAEPLTLSTMAFFGDASGSIWENWLRDHGQWIWDSKDPVEAVGKFLWTPFGAALTGVAAYTDELERNPAGTLVKTAGAATAAVFPAAGVFGLAVDGAAVAGGHVLGGELNRQQAAAQADQRLLQEHRQTVQTNTSGRSELDELYG